MTTCEKKALPVGGSSGPLGTADDIRACMAEGQSSLQSLFDRSLQLLDRYESMWEGLHLPSSGKSVPVVDAAKACHLLEKSIPLRVRMLQMSTHQEECVEDLMQISIALAAVRDHIRRCEERNRGA